MKLVVKLIVLLCVLFSTADAQVYIKPNNSYGQIVNRLRADSTLLFPTGCGLPQLRSTDQGMSDLYYDSCAAKLYVYNPSTKSWTNAGGIAQVDLDTSRTVDKVNIANSAGTGAVIPSADSTSAGVMKVNDFIKLSRFEWDPVQNRYYIRTPDLDPLAYLKDVSDSVSAQVVFNKPFSGTLRYDSNIVVIPVNRKGIQFVDPYPTPSFDRGFLYGYTNKPGPVAEFDYWLPRGGNTMFSTLRRFDEIDGDTAMQQYQGIATYIQNYDFLKDGTSRFERGVRNDWAPQSSGVTTAARIFPPKNIDITIDPMGRNFSPFYGSLGIGKDSLYNIHLKTPDVYPVPATVYESIIDFDRGTGNKQRVITSNGLGLSNYFASWKNYQSGNTSTLGSYISKVSDYVSGGSLYRSPYGTSMTKENILLRSTADTVMGFWSRPKYTLQNEVKNGVGFYQQGNSDFNSFEGRTVLGPMDLNSKYRFEVKGGDSSKLSGLVRFMDTLKLSSTIYGNDRGHWELANNRIRFWGNPNYTFGTSDIISIHSYREAFHHIYMRNYNNYQDAAIGFLFRNDLDRGMQYMVSSSNYLFGRDMVFLRATTGNGMKISTDLGKLIFQVGAVTANPATDTIRHVMYVDSDNVIIRKAPERTFDPELYKVSILDGYGRVYRTSLEDFVTALPEQDLYFDETLMLINDSTISVKTDTALFNANKIMNIAVSDATPTAGQVLKYVSGEWTPADESGGGGGISDGDKGDITVSGSGTVWTINTLSIDNDMISDMAWSKITGTPTTLSGYGITNAVGTTGNQTVAGNKTFSGYTTISNNTLRITGGMGQFRIDDQSGGYETSIYRNSGNLIFSVQRPDFNFYTPITLNLHSPNNSLYMNSSGNIGLGTASPTANLHTAASTTTRASIRIPVGTAPTSPNAGDLWSDASNTLVYRSGSVTKNVSTTLATLTANTTVSNTDGGGVKLINATSGALTITLPAVANSTAVEYTFKKIDDSANTVTISAASGTIDGNSSVVLNVQYDWVKLISDGTNWYVIGGN